MTLDSISTSTGQDFESDAPNGNTATADDRRQYTIKSLDTETIQLMKEAARKEGMKIGAWASMHLKAAAVRSLNGESHHVYPDLLELIRKGESERENDRQRIREIEDDLLQLRDQIKR